MLDDASRCFIKKHPGVGWGKHPGFGFAITHVSTHCWPKNSKPECEFTRPKPALYCVPPGQMSAWDAN